MTALRATAWKRRTLRCANASGPCGSIGAPVANPTHFSSVPVATSSIPSWRSGNRRELTEVGIQTVETVDGGVPFGQTPERRR